MLDTNAQPIGRLEAKVELGRKETKDAKSAQRGNTFATIETKGVL